MNRLAHTTVIAAALLTLVGCGGDDGTPAAAPTPATVAAAAGTTAPATTAAPTPVALTIQEAAARYTAIVKPGNALLFGEFTRAADAYDTNPTDATRVALATAARHLTAAYRTQAQAFRSTPWPAAVQPAMNDLIKANATSIGAVNNLAAAKTDADVQAAYALFDDQAQVQAAELVRQALGLPSAPTS